MIWVNFSRLQFLHLKVKIGLKESEMSIGITFSNTIALHFCFSNNLLWKTTFFFEANVIPYSKLGI